MLQNKTVSTLKKACQAIWLMVDKTLSLEEAFSCPITTVLLSITTLDGKLRQSEKASLQN